MENSSDYDSDSSLNTSSSDDSDLKMINKNNGYTCEFNKDTPLIKSLINKRISYCNLGASSHIAAFFSEPIRLSSCIEGSGKGKDRYWRKF